MMMHGGGGQQGGDGEPRRIHAAVREDENVVTLAHRRLGLLAETLQGRRHAGGALLGAVAHVQGTGAKGTIGVAVDVADAFQILIGEDGLMDLQAHVAAGLIQVQQVGARPDEGHQGHHQLLADGIDGRIGNLGEVLLEIIEQRLGTV